MTGLRKPESLKLARIRPIEQVAEKAADRIMSMRTKNANVAKIPGLKSNMKLPGLKKL